MTKIQEKIKVLYIAGVGRSGSTLLGNILGSIEGFFHAGMPCFVWENGISVNSSSYCGCGSPFRECQVWQSIFDTAYNGFDSIGEKDIKYLGQNIIQNRHLPFRLLLPNKSRTFCNPQTLSYLKNLELLYQSIKLNTDCKVIVDSSKFPSYAYMLSLIPSIELYIVHLVRDPRAVAYSWQKKRQRTDVDPNSTLFQEQYQPFTTSKGWLLWNILLELLGQKQRDKYLFFKYEEFAKSPKIYIQKIIDFVEKGNNIEGPPWVSSDEIDLNVNHTIWGNPVRAKTGIVKIVPDEEWREKMSLLDKTKVTTITFPLLLKYRYVNQKSSLVYNFP